MTTPELGDPVAIYRFIDFIQRTEKLWICRNRESGEWLGAVTYSSPWRQYIIRFNEYAEFSHDCLADIQDFLKKQNLKGKHDHA